MLFVNHQFILCFLDAFNKRTGKLCPISQKTILKQWYVLIVSSSFSDVRIKYQKKSLRVLLMPCKYWNSYCFGKSILVFGVCFLSSSKSNNLVPFEVQSNQVIRFCCQLYFGGMFIVWLTERFDSIVITRAFIISRAIVIPRVFISSFKLIFGTLNAPDDVRTGFLVQVRLIIV